MMKVGRWGLIGGLLFLFTTKTPWGFVLGFFVGEWLRVFFSQVMRSKTKQNHDLFMTITFEVLGHLSKSKGVVTENDIQIAYRVMDQFRLNAQARKRAQEAFERGKSPSYPLRERLKTLYRGYWLQRNALKVFLEFQIAIALSDQQLDPNEHRILMIIAEELRVSKQQLEMIIQMMASGSQFHEKHSSQRQSAGNAFQQPSLSDAYHVLGVKTSDDAITVKRAYRKLMNTHHPDKLAGKGVPPEMLEMAKERAQAIQAAYDLIKQHRGFK